MPTTTLFLLPVVDLLVTLLTFSKMRRATLRSLLKCRATTFQSDDWMEISMRMCTPLTLSFFEKCIPLELYCFRAFILTWCCCSTYWSICLRRKNQFGLFLKYPSIGWNTTARCAWMTHIDGNQLQQLNTYVLMDYTLSQIQSRLSLAILFTMEREAELPMIHHQAYNGW